MDRREILVVLFFVLVVLFALEGNSQQLICENRNPDGHTGGKQSGDGSFGLSVQGPAADSGQYFPNQVYTVTIRGLKTRYSTSKFIEFILVVESEKQAMMGQSGLVTTGIFHIVDNTQSTFSYSCPDAIINSNLKPKYEISVKWTAPSVLVASCITFKTTVVERPHIWFMDDGNLTKTLCPYEKPTTTTTTTTTSSSPLQIIPTVQVGLEDSNQEQTKLEEDYLEDNQCCPCDEAKYEVNFEGVWSKESHPKDFPENVWLLHFSDIIGASHSKEFYFWKVGQSPSEGIRHVAEWGATRQLENELKTKKKYVNTIIKARGLWHPNEKGRTSASFRVDKSRHLMSLVTMIGPSPDWFVGVSGFDLCTKNCTWLDEVDFDLFPYDAGTDSGISYMSPNTATDPRGTITELNSTYPNDTRSPFYAPNGPPMKPFATARIRRQRIYRRRCTDSLHTSEDSHEVIVSENTEDASRPECAVTDWTPWSDCSVTCGKGLRMRVRSYRVEAKATMMGCDRQLVEKEMCLAASHTCDSEDDGIEEVISICEVTNWSEWTPCSVTCGKGVQHRNRRYRNHMGRKKCNREMAETQMCTGMKSECGSDVLEPADDTDCPVTPWSEWSPCSTTCGEGQRQRSRFYHLSDKVLPLKCSRMEMTQNSLCTGEYGNCNIGMVEAKEICMLPPETGLCRANQERFFFSLEKGMCVPFTYGGCKGNRNRFENVEECSRICGFLSGQPASLEISNTTINTNIVMVKEESIGNLNLNSHRHTNTPTTELNFEEIFTTTPDTRYLEKPLQEPEVTDQTVLLPVDCVVSDWTEWSECSVTCGVGQMTRDRLIIVEPQNEGQRCPRRLKKRRVCRMAPC